MAITDGAGVRKKRATRYVCCTPPRLCNGALTGEGDKTHTGSEEVHKCQGKYLVSLGYTRISKREYRAPNKLDKDGNVIEGGYILILNKKAARAKGGKADRYMRGSRLNEKLRSW